MTNNHCGTCGENHDGDFCDKPPIPVMIKKTCPRCKGRGFLPISIRKPRRAFSVRMIKCQCQLHDNKES